MRVARVHLEIERKNQETRYDCKIKKIVLHKLRIL